MAESTPRRVRPGDEPRVRALHERVLRETGAYVDPDGTDAAVHADLRDRLTLLFYRGDLRGGAD